MTKDNAINIINNEKLSHFNFFNEHNIDANEVVINYVDNQWIVYTTDERQNIAGIKKVFFSESDALENFINRLRAGKKYRDLNTATHTEN